MQELIVAFSFGRIGNVPNRSSVAIAHAIYFHRLHDPDPVRRIVAQWEVEKELVRIGIPVARVAKRQGDRYLSTADVAASAAVYVNAVSPSLRFDRVLAAAHPDHVARCIRCLRNAGIPDALPLPSTAVYDPRSDERWVRSRAAFKLREFIATPYYAWKGELR